MVNFRICDPGEAKVADAEVTVGIEEEIGRLEIPVETVGGMDVLEAANDLVKEVADVVVAQFLGPQQLE